MALARPKLVGHAEKPVRFLYYHALELYLKALLRQKHSVQILTDKFGHNIKRLVQEAEALGLVVADGDRDVFSVDPDTMIEMRYIQTGSKTTQPTLQNLCRTCKSVRDNVCGILRKAGELGSELINFFALTIRS
jgi:hypothetical protein